MATEETKPKPKRHHRYETSVDIELIGVNIRVHDILDCYIGVYENIQIESEGQKVEIEGSVRPNGKREVKVYKNGRLVKHTVGSQVISEENKDNQWVKYKEKCDKTAKRQLNDFSGYHLMTESVMIITDLYSIGSLQSNKHNRIF